MARARPSLTRRVCTQPSADAPTVGSARGMHQAGPADVPEQLQARLLAILDDGVVGTDADFRITHWNPGPERLYGHTAAEVLGVPANQSRRSPATTSASTSSASSSSTARSRVEITAV